HVERAVGRHAYTEQAKRALLARLGHQGTPATHDVPARDVDGPEVALHVSHGHRHRHAAELCLLVGCDTRQLARLQDRGELDLVFWFRGRPALEGELSDPERRGRCQHDGALAATDAREERARMGGVEGEFLVAPGDAPMGRLAVGVEDTDDLADADKLLKERPAGVEEETRRPAGEW